jgi:hypothetical protein
MMTRSEPYWLDDRGFEFRGGLGIFLFTTASRSALGPTQPFMQWVPGILSLEVRRPGREADHSPPSSAEVKNAWNYTSTPPYPSMTWCSVKKKHRDNFIFYLHFMMTRSFLSIPNHNSCKYESEETVYSFQRNA